MHALTLNTSALFSNTSARNMQVHLHNACTGALVLIQMHCIQCTKIYLLKTSTMTCSVYLLSK